MIQSAMMITALFVLLGSCCRAVDGDVVPDVDVYFDFMRKYLGKTAFEQHQCLQQQQQFGWVSSNKSTAPMRPYALGVEGSGHHNLITLLKWGDEVDPRAHFQAVRGRVGAFSVPCDWRTPNEKRAVRQGMHPDIPLHVHQGQLIFVLLRYPPASYLSLTRRFAYCQTAEEASGPLTYVTFRVATDNHPSIHPSIHVSTHVLVGRCAIAKFTFVCAGMRPMLVVISTRVLYVPEYVWVVTIGTTVVVVIGWNTRTTSVCMVVM